MNRNFGLDVMRSLSIWLVLLQHGGINIKGLTPLRIGSIGVEIFFVLSGFLIGGILFREIDKGNSFKKTLTTFWTRRWLRILPLYYAVLLFKFFFIDDSVGLNILYYFFFLQNNFYGISFLNVSWSLVIEEWFYIFTPFIIMFLFRFLKNDFHILLGMIGVILFIIIIRTLYVVVENASYEGINSNFPFRFDSLFLGVIVAFIRHNGKDQFNRLSSPSIFLLGVTIFLSYLYYYWRLSYPINTINDALIPRTIGFFILPFGISLMVPYISKWNWDPKKNYFNKSIFLFVNTTSVLTYSIYLLHPFIYSLKLPLLITVIITYLISWLTYNYFEKPILNFRDRITEIKAP